MPKTNKRLSESKSIVRSYVRHKRHRVTEKRVEPLKKTEEKKAPVWPDRFVFRCNVCKTDVFRPVNVIDEEPFEKGDADRFVTIFHYQHCPQRRVEITTRGPEWIRDLLD